MSIQNFMKICDSFPVEQDWIESSENVISKWACYISPILRINGWKALWTPSKQSSLQYSVNFFKSFLVQIHDVHYSSLNAVVHLIDDNGERINLIGKDPISIHLQELSLLDNVGTQMDDVNIAANACLNDLRLFFKYLWWPWEIDEDLKLQHWLSKNIEGRLKLYHSLSKGISCSDTIKALIHDGKVLHKQLCLYNDRYDHDNENSNTLIEGVELFKNLEEVKAKLQRYVNISPVELESINALRNQSDNAVYIIAPFLEVNELADYLKLIALKSPKSILRKVVRSLKSIMWEYKQDSVVFLFGEKHLFSPEYFYINVTIECPTSEKTIISSNSSYWCLLHSVADSLTLTNFNIEIDENHVALYVKNGVTSLNTIRFKNVTSVPKGKIAIILGENGTLIGNDCHFDNFDTAIVCLPGSAIQLTNCSFDGNSVDIQGASGIQLLLSNIVSRRRRRSFIQFDVGLPEKGFKSLLSLEKIEGVQVESIILDSEEGVVEFV